MARNWRRTLTLSVALLLCAASLYAQPVDVTIVTEDGRTTLPVSEFSGQSMVPLMALTELVGAEFRTATDKAVQVALGGTVARLSDGMNFVPVAGRTVMLQSPPRLVSGEWFVPLDFLSRVLPSLSRTPVTYRARERLLLLGDTFPKLQVSTSRDPSYTRVEITTSRRVPMEVSQSAGEIRLILLAPYLETGFADEEILDGVVDRIGLSRREGHYEVRVALGPWFGALKAFERDYPEPGIVLDLLRSRVPNAGGRATGVDVIQEDLRSMVARQEALQAEALREERAPSEEPDPDAPDESELEFETIQLPPDYALPTRETLEEPPSGPTRLRIVTIDPGHGGAETGAEGRNGLVEKELVLAISRKLKTLLQDRLGVRVILTRDGDRNLALDERAAIANNNKADLFLSIHADASTRRDARGSSVYFLSYSSDGAGGEGVASAVGRVSGAGARSELEFILWDMAQASHLTQSSQLAEILQEELRASTDAGRVNRGIKQNTFRVLKGATMPAVLVELGFISNPEEESLLASQEHQQKLAEALYRGVLRFKDIFEYEPRANESASSRSRP